MGRESLCIKVPSGFLNGELVQSSLLVLFLHLCPSLPPLPSCLSPLTPPRFEDCTDCFKADYLGDYLLCLPVTLVLLCDNVVFEACFGVVSITDLPPSLDIFIPRCISSCKEG